MQARCSAAQLVRFRQNIQGVVQSGYNLSLPEEGKNSCFFFPGVSEVERRTSAADKPLQEVFLYKREKQGQDDEDFREVDLSILGKSRGGGHWTRVEKRTLRCVVYVSAVSQ